MFLLVILSQVANPPPMTNYDFWLAVIDRLTPLVDAFFKLVTPISVGVGAWILYKARHDIRETRVELGEVHEKVNGQGEELRSLTGRAAHAEGQVEILKEVVAVPPVQVPGGRRADDHILPVEVTNPIDVKDRP